MTHEDVDMRSVAILIAALGAQVGDEAPATRALRDFMAERSEATWAAARTLFNKLPGPQRASISDSATTLAMQLKQSDGGVLSLLKSIGRRRAAERAAGVMDWMDEDGGQKPKRGKGNGRLRETVWR
jgi:hypothetical protein